MMHSILWTTLFFFQIYKLMVFRAPQTSGSALIKKKRTQTCLVNGNKSSTILRCGVPQGTILMSLLFLLYIDDLPSSFHHSQPRMYADDTRITFAGSADVDGINNCINFDLERICVWLAANKIILNI